MLYKEGARRKALQVCANSFVLAAAPASRQHRKRVRHLLNCLAASR